MTRPQRMTRREAVAVSVAALGGAAALTAGLPAPAAAAPRTAPAAAGDQPWRDKRKSPSRRADSLLGAMTFEEQAVLVTAITPADFEPLHHLGIPAMTYVDASDGLRGDTGVTAFPAPNALAATFDTDLAERYGHAIGAEARAKGWNVLLGPTVDIERTPRAGRAAESYGEDPLVSGLIGGAVTRGFQQNDVIAQIKHFTCYNQEESRNSLDVKVSERALREVYYPAFEHTIRDGGALSVMGSYPRVNGVFACQNPHLISALKDELGLKGYLGTDYRPGADDIEAIKNGVDCAALIPDTPKAAFTDGRIPKDRTRDACRRILYALFASGTYDNPVPTTPAAVVTSDAHQILARITGEQATVLLKNNDNLLPLPKGQTIAVIGPAGKDATTGVEGSSYVDPGDFTTAADAIKAKTGASRVLCSQGTLGDVALPVIPGQVLTTPDGEPGLKAEFFAGEDLSGELLATTTTAGVDFRGSDPVADLPVTWSARWTGRLAVPHTGWIRFNTLLSGAAKLVIDGTTVFNGSRFLWDFFFGPKEFTLGGVVHLTGGTSVDIAVEYSTKGAGFNGPGMKLCWQPESLIPDAVATAKKADVAVVFVNNYTGEGIDRDDLALPGDQNQLIDAVAAANPNTVVVLNTSGPMLMPWLGKVKSVLQAWYLGAATGTSIAGSSTATQNPADACPSPSPPTRPRDPPPTQEAEPAVPTAASPTTKASTSATSGTTGTTPSRSSPSATDCRTPPSATAARA